MNSIFCTVVFSLLLTLVFAQRTPVVPSPFDAELFTVKNGLSQGLVSAIIQDRFGFMWFGTYDGLNRYDGYNVTVYRNNHEDSNSLSENIITALFMDSKGRLWVGTQTAALDLFEYEKESFIHLRHNDHDENSISDDHILSIAEDNNGALWVGTNNGLNKIVIKENSNQIIRSGGDRSSPFLQTHKIIIRHIQLDPGKELFAAHELAHNISSFKPELFIDQQHHIFVRTEFDYFSISPSRDKADTIVRLPGLTLAVEDESKIAEIIALTKSYYQRDLFLYFAATKFVAETNPINGVVTLIKEFDRVSMSSRHRHPFVNGVLWFTYNFRLFQYLEASNRVIAVQSDQPEEQRFMDHSFSLFQDNSNKIWVGTSGYGALKINTSSAVFNRVKGQSVHWLRSSSDTVIISESSNTYFLKKETSNDHSTRRIQHRTGFSCFVS